MSSSSTPHVTAEQLGASVNTRGFVGPCGPKTSHSDSTQHVASGGSITYASRADAICDAARRLLGMRCTGSLMGEVDVLSNLAPPTFDKFLERHFRIDLSDEAFAFTRSVLREFDAMFVASKNNGTLIMVSSSALASAHVARRLDAAARTTTTATTKPAPRAAPVRRRLVSDTMNLDSALIFAPASRSFSNCDVPQKERERAAFHTLTLAMPFDPQFRKKIITARRLQTALESWAHLRDASTRICTPRTLILVLEHGFSAAIMTSMSRVLRDRDIQLLFFSLTELLHVRSHQYLPMRSRVLPRKEKAQVLKRLRANQSELKKLPSNDALARWMDARTGDIVENLEPTPRGFVRDFRVVSRPVQKKTTKGNGRASAASAASSDAAEHERDEGGEGEAEGEEEEEAADAAEGGADEEDGGDGASEDDDDAEGDEDDEDDEDDSDDSDSDGGSGGDGESGDSDSGGSGSEDRDSMSEDVDDEDEDGEEDDEDDDEEGEDGDGDGEEDGEGDRDRDLNPTSAMSSKVTGGQRRSAASATTTRPSASSVMKRAAERPRDGKRVRFTERL